MWPGEEEVIVIFSVETPLVIMFQHKTSKLLQQSTPLLNSSIFESRRLSSHSPGAKRGLEVWTLSHCLAMFNDDRHQWVIA